MSQKHSDKMLKYSRELRKNMTKEERMLWYEFLQYLPVTVNRQKIFGIYIVDFYVAEAKMVIEIDGIQHEFGEGKVDDLERDKYFKSIDIEVLRIPNYALKKDFDRICDYIAEQLSRKCGFEIKPNRNS